MKSGLLLVAGALLLGGLVGTLVLRDPGYVLIAYADSAIETSLWFALLVLVLGYLLLRVGITLFSSTLHSGSAFGRWRQRRKGVKSRNQTLQGMLMLAQGNWSSARKMLITSAGVVETPLINFLGAARAAHESGDYQGRDELLAQARASTPGSDFAVNLTKAELQQSAGEWQQSLATLLELKQQQPRHTLMLKMLIGAYQQLNDYQALLDVLPDARKAKVFSDSDYHELLLEAWIQRIEAAEDSATEVFAQLPKELGHDARVVACYARQLMARGKDQLAVEPVRKILKQTWQAELVRLFGELGGDDAAAQLKVAEGWLKAHSNDADLLLTLGRLSLRTENWSQAREYLEASLRARPDDEVYAELGRLCLASGDVSRGSEYLLQSRRALPDLPLPSAEQARPLEESE